MPSVGAPNYQRYLVPNNLHRFSRQYESIEIQDIAPVGSGIVVQNDAWSCVANFFGAIKFNAHPGRIAGHDRKIGIVQYCAVATTFRLLDDVGRGSGIEHRK
jgi:hypothetical protein